MSWNRRSVLKTAGGIGAALGFAGTGQGRLLDPATMDGGLQQQASREPAIGVDLGVRQEPGKSVHWVLPGERRLDEAVFGTPEYPQFGRDLLQLSIDRAPESVAALLREFPLQVALPEKARNVEDGSYTTSKIPTPFSDKATQTAGHFDLTYRDRTGVSHDPMSNDGARIDIAFEDPAGNTYEVDLKGFETEGAIHETGAGVMTNAVIHGDTAMGTPLEPRQYLYGAFWGVCDLIVNGEVADTNRAVHFMTTEVVRDSEYRLAVTDELPLGEDEAFAGQAHHTHGIFPPVKATPKGPVFDPIPVPFELPNGNRQPFIHVMFDEDTITGFEATGGAGAVADEEATSDDADRDDGEDTATGGNGKAKVGNGTRAG